MDRLGFCGCAEETYDLEQAPFFYVRGAPLDYPFAKFNLHRSRNDQNCPGSHKSTPTQICPETLRGMSDCFLGNPLERI
jgi:hypothetical protein